MDDRGRSKISWQRVLGWALSLAALVFLGRWLWQVDRQVWHQLRVLDLRLAAVSLVIFQLWFFLRYLGWDMISRRFGLVDRQQSNLRLWALSEFMRYIPGNVWSFAARYKGARQRGSTASGATMALIMEAVSMTAGSAVVAGFFWRPGWWWVWLLGALFFVTMVPWLLSKIAARRTWSFPGLTYRSTLSLLGLYVLVWISYGLAQALIMKAIPDMTTPALMILIGANVAAWFVGYISILTPMGLGVREVALVSFLGTSITRSVASVFALITRVWLVICELVFIGLVLIISRRKV